MAVATKRPKLNGFVNRIKLIGIELEGGWDLAPRGEDIVKDGSVKFPATTPSSPGSIPLAATRALFESDMRRAVEALSRPSPELSGPQAGPQFKGEIVSKPMAVSKMPGWLAHAYPKYVNETCGLHVHMSFHYRVNYSRLMVPEFTHWMVNRLREWAEAEKLPADHPQWNRFDPTHPWTLQHCSHAYLGEGQVKATRKDYESRGKPHSRYTFINYCDGMHKTIEVRGMSMPETAEQAQRAIIAVLDATNSFLSKIRQREQSERVTVKARPESIQEFRTYLRAA